MLELGAMASAVKVLYEGCEMVVEGPELEDMGAYGRAVTFHTWPKDRIVSFPVWK